MALVEKVPDDSSMGDAVRDAVDVEEVAEAVIVDLVLATHDVGMSESWQGLNVPVHFVVFPGLRQRPELLRAQSIADNFSAGTGIGPLKRFKARFL